VVELNGPMGLLTVPAHIQVTPSGTAGPISTATRPVIAETGDRLVARLIDWAVFVTPQLILIGKPRYSWALYSLFAVMALHEIVTVALTGQTLGKWLLRLRVVRAADGSVPGWGPSLLRWLIQFVAWIPFLLLGAIPMYLSPLWDKSGRRQGWHDKVAGTVVVKAGRKSSRRKPP
jgi:uncharacterized RDD family membrane protein YckC